ncbi:peptidase M4 [Pyrenophora tritici-repentis]|nr:peptidase M4 [Pyrenophora tritici-repentis]
MEHPMPLNVMSCALELRLVLQMLGEASPPNTSLGQLLSLSNLANSKPTISLERSARSEGEVRIKDRQVNNVYDGFKITHDFFSKIFGRNSLDSRGLPLIGSVHYKLSSTPDGYNNAFWDGEAQRMVFGDGDHITFDFLTDSLDVIAHELSHGFVQFSSPLEYASQSGALNKSCADIFGSMVEQWHMHQSPKHMDDLYKGPNNRGGVHINSGIPNHAFYLAAKSLGGSSWERAGKLWYKTMISGKIEPNCDFKTFARATVDIAGEGFVDKSVQMAIRDAWVKVGVLAQTKI